MRYKFGDKLRRIRERKKLTLKDVANGADVSESLVSQIEHDKVSPAIDTLLRISDVLEVDLEYIFSDYKKDRTVHIVHADGRQKLDTDGVIYERLAHIGDEDEDHGIEAYHMRIAPGAEKGSREYGHRGSELGIIISGSGTFRFGSREYRLKTGDSISYASDIPHTLINTGKKELKAYWIVTPAKSIFKEI